MDDPSPHPTSHESANDEFDAPPRRDASGARTAEGSASRADGPRAGSARATPRLDLEAAARLAQDARSRMRASQAQLAHAHEQVGTPREHERKPESPRGWTRRALAPESSPEIAPTNTAGSPPNEATELIELRAALEIAHDTAEVQREERRTILAENQRLRAESTTLSETLDRVHDEHVGLVTVNADLEAQRDELVQVARLESAAAAQLQGQIEALEDRARRAEALLERLRATLQEDGADIAEHETAYTGFRLHTEEDSDPSAAPSADSPAALSQPSLAEPTIQPRAERAPRGVPAQLSSIYDAWLDDQLRRHFGAMGIDDLADLVAAPIQRSPRDAGEASRIVLIGDECQRLAVPLADTLLEKTESAIEIFVLDAAPSRKGASLGLASDHPLGESVRVVPTGSDPASLERTLHEIQPDVLVARSLLSGDPRLEEWLTLLSDLHDSDCDLILLERSARDAEPPPSEMIEIGDRIWDLMPERYKALGEQETGFATWAEAFAATSSPPCGDGLSRLRETYRFELFAQFGYLAEPFVGSPIGENFSVDAARDRRFLRQLSDLDDRRVEAGTIRGLHWVAWIASSESSTSDDAGSPQT